MPVRVIFSSLPMHWLDAVGGGRIPKGDSVSKRNVVPILALATVMALLSCGGNITLPAPTLNTLSPTSIVAGQPGFTLTCNGQNFSPQSQVLWNGSARVSFFLSVTQMTAMITSNDISAPGSFPITVFTPSPGGGTTGIVYFTVNPAQSGIPTVTSVSPTGAYAGSNSVNIQVNGTGFTNTSVVTFNGGNRPTTYINGQELMGILLNTDLETAEVAEIAVLNSGPGGGSSNSIPFSITGAPPSISVVSPTTTTANGTTVLTVSVTGAGYSTSSLVNLNGSPRTTIYVSGTELNFNLNPADTTAAQTYQVTVFNPPPGGGTSNIVGFSITASSTGVGLPQLVDIATDGVQANQGIGILTNSGPSDGGSGLGRFSAFASTSTNLVTSTLTNPLSQQSVYAHDTCLGITAGCTPATIGANIANDNVTVANAPSFEPSMGGNGQYVSFSSAATNLLVGASSGAQQIYFRNTCIGNLNCSTTANGGTPENGANTAFTALVSVAPDGVTPGNGDSSQSSISQDGRYVAFTSVATNLVAGATSGASEIYLRDTCLGISSGCTPTTILVSTPDGSTPADGASSQPIVGNNGLFVAFSSTATILGGGAGGIQQIYLRGTCVNASSCTTSTSLVSAADAAGTVPGNAASQQATIDNVGRFIAFSSNATNLGTAPGGAQQIYLRDMCTGASGCTPSTSLVSTPDGMTAGKGSSSSPSISNSGQYIAFDSLASNLVTADLNGLQNVFVRNSCAGVSSCTASTVLVSVSASGAQGNGASQKPAISGDGHFVQFISAATDLVGNDLNGLPDIFLAVTTF